MHHIVGIVMRDSEIEVIEDEAPEKGHFMGLFQLMKDWEVRIKADPNIKQVNFYRMHQGGQRILAHQIFSELVPPST